jgi:FtsP/CotA-like multicopper oxidase with cupredoxin domain
MPTIPNIMQFRASLPLSERDRPLPDSLTPVPLIAESAASRTRDISIEEDEDPVTGEPLMATMERSMWDDLVLEDPKAGTVEIWRLINTTDDAHPIHVPSCAFKFWTASRSTKITTLRSVSWCSPGRRCPLRRTKDQLGKTRCAQIPEW